MSSKDDWNAIVEQEDGELYILSLIEHILAKSQQVLFDKRIDIQILPFASSFCKETAIELIARDEGTGDMWDMDSEAEPVPIDSWARAALPIKTITSDYKRPLVHSVQTMTESKTQNLIKRLAHQRIQSPPTHKNVRKSSVRRISIRPVSPHREKEIDVPRLINEENKRMLARIHNIQVHGAQEYAYDPNGRIVLQTPPVLTNQRQERYFRQAKLDKDKKSTNEHEKEKKGNAKIDKDKKIFITKPEKEKKVKIEEDFIPDDAHMPLVDTITLASGVTLKEGNNVRKGPSTKKMDVKSIEVNVLQPFDSEMPSMRGVSRPIGNIERGVVCIVQL